MPYTPRNTLSYLEIQERQMRRQAARQTAPRSYRVDELTTDAEIADLADALLVEFEEKE